MSRLRCVECDYPENEGHGPTCPVLENERALRAANRNEIAALVSDSPNLRSDVAPQKKEKTKC